MNNLELLKELRQEKGDTQSDVARALNISQKAYSYYERGEREPSIDMLIQISNYFNVTVDYLINTLIAEKTTIINRCLRRIEICSIQDL